MRCLFALLTVCGISLPATAQFSTFDFDNEGWRCDGDPVSNIAQWQATGGNPAGHIRMVDASTGGTWYFVAPAKFLGPKCDAYGKYLRYDQFASNTSNANNSPDVQMKGGGLTLVFNHPIQPGTTWTHYDLLLREDAGWRINNFNGPTPTQEQFKAALANVTSLRLRGEFYHQADDFGGLDNVRLESNFQFDLDGDDSSGETNGNFRADTTCYLFSPIIDTDAILTSESAVDSIQIILLNPNGLEVLENTALPSTLLLRAYAPDQVTLVNVGNATLADFLTALQAFTYRDQTPNPERAVRQVVFRVFSGCGEAGNRTAFLPIFPPASAGSDGDTTLCANGEAVPLFTVLQGFPGANGYWEPPLPTAAGIFDPLKNAPGRYAYILPKAGECEADTAYVTVAVEQLPTLRPDTTLCYGDTLHIEKPRELVQWQWGDGTHKSALNITFPDIYVLAGETTHCLFADSVRVDFFTCEECPLYVPNVFSPNDDQANDEWQAFLPCRWVRFHLEVFDRWGSLVFVADDPNIAWDGRVKGREAATGVYVWHLEWDAELLGAVRTWRGVGDVTIVR
jgi:gliding motility-associated-like protein